MEISLPQRFRAFRLSIPFFSRPAAPGAEQTYRVVVAARARNGTLYTPYTPCVHASSCALLVLLHARTHTRARARALRTRAHTNTLQTLMHARTHARTRAHTKHVVVSCTHVRTQRYTTLHSTPLNNTLKHAHLRTHAHRCRANASCTSRCMSRSAHLLVIC